MDQKLFGRLAVIAALALTILASACEAQTPSPPSSATPEKSTSAADQAETPPDWKPDEALLDKLGPYEEIEGFEIRVPKQFKEAFSQALPKGGKVAAWLLPADKDDKESAGKYRPIMIVTVFEPAADSPASKDTLSKTFKDMMPTFKQSVGITEWTPTPKEQGRISGIPFIRIGWQGVVQGEKGRGFLYVGKTDGAFLAIYIADSDPRSKETVKILSAAVMSFRKKK